MARGVNSMAPAARAAMAALACPLLASVVLQARPGAADSAADEALARFAAPGAFRVRESKLELYPDRAVMEEEAERLLKSDEDEALPNYTSIKQPDVDFGKFALWMPERAPEGLITAIAKQLLGNGAGNDNDGNDEPEALPLVVFVHPTFGMKTGRWGQVYNRAFLEHIVSHGFAVAFPLDLKWHARLSCSCQGRSVFGPVWCHVRGWFARCGWCAVPPCSRVALCRCASPPKARKATAAGPRV